ENLWIVLSELDDAGRVQRAEVWEAEQGEQAHARFAEIARRGAASGGRLANAATRALDRGTAALGARDWDGFGALFAKDLRVVARTSTGQFESDGATWLAGFREMLEMTSSKPVPEVLATRGDRLALARAVWRGAAGDVGPSEVEWLL